jgi:hypothetical protein
MKKACVRVPDQAEKPASRRLSGAEIVRLGMARRQRRWLIAGIALVVCGLGVQVWSMLIEAEDADDPSARRELLTSAQAKSLHARSVRYESKFATAAKLADRKTAKSVDHAKARLKALEALGLETPPKFIHPADLKLPDFGLGLQVYCLLRQPLDPATEEQWRKAGLLAGEFQVINPYVRTLTIKERSDLRELYIWQVEGVCTDLYGSQMAAVPAVASEPVMVNAN